MISKSLDIDIRVNGWRILTKHGDIIYSSFASFMACVEECISERESWRFEGLTISTTVQLFNIYKWFGKSVEFKKCLDGVYVMQSLDRVHTV